MPFLKSLVVIGHGGFVRGPFGRGGLGVRVSGRQPSAVTTTVSSIADAAVLGEVHARLDGDHVAGGERSSRTSGATRGASWMSRPTPWPVPWVKASPQPASSMTSRQAASTSLAATPARTAATPGGLRLDDDVEHPLLGRPRARPTMTVRVMSEQ